MEGGPWDVDTQASACAQGSRCRRGEARLWHPVALLAPGGEPDPALLEGPRLRLHPEARPPSRAQPSRSAYAASDSVLSGFLCQEPSPTR